MAMQTELLTFLNRVWLENETYLILTQCKLVCLIDIAFFSFAQNSAQFKDLLQFHVCNRLDKVKGIPEICTFLDF